MSAVPGARDRTPALGSHRESSLEPRGRRSPRSWLRVAASAGPPVLVIGFLTWPMLFTSSGMEEDWDLHMWAVWRQSLAIARDHSPTLFINDLTSVYYPMYAFYNSTIYSLDGLLAILLGHAYVTAYVATYVLGFAAAYGGWYWLARMAGLGRWLSQAPGFIFITSSYYLTDVYGRGDWGEFIAISTIPLLVAAGLHVLLEERLKLLPALTLMGSTLVFFGSHNITMLWGTSTLVALALVVAAAVPQARRRITRRGAIRVAALVAPAPFLSAWYLLPALAYGRNIWIVHNFGYAHSLRNTLYLVSAKHLFTLSRASAATPLSQYFPLALPIMAVAWVIAGVAFSLWRRKDEPWRRALWIFSGMALLLGIVMTHPSLTLTLPAPYAVIQYEYRLEAYVLLGLCAAMIAVLVLARERIGRSRVWAGSLALVLIVSAVGAVQQVDHYPRLADRYSTFSWSNPPVTPKGPRKLIDFEDTTEPSLNPGSVPEVHFPPEAVHDEKVALAVNLPSGQLVRSNLASAPYLVTVTGASIVGRSRNGLMVLRVAPHPPGAAQRIAVRRADGLPIRLGRLLSLLALAYLALALLVLLARSLRPWILDRQSAVA
jgi:hypothetical protein